jgi:hypothetical protein
MKPRKTVVMLVAGMAFAASIEVASVGVAGAASNTTQPTPPKTKTVPKPKTVKPVRKNVKPLPRKQGTHTNRRRSRHTMTPRVHKMPKHRRAPVHAKRR